MPEQQESRGPRLQREKAAYRYTTALETANIDALIAVLQQAEHDPVLEQMLVETHEAYMAEDHSFVHADEIRRVNNLLFDAPSTEPFPLNGSGQTPRRHRTRLQRFGAFARAIAAVLVVAALLGSFVVLFASHHPGVGTSASLIWKNYSSTLPGSSDTNLNSVAVISTNDVWAVGGLIGDYPLTEHWNGKQWTSVNDPVPGYLYGVAGVSSNDVWAVGVTSRQNHPPGTQALIEHWDGKQWKVVNTPPISGILFSVAVVSARDVWAVGSTTPDIPDSVDSQALIEHWNGSQWTIVKSPEGYYDVLYGIAVVSEDDIWTVGFSSLKDVTNSSQTLIEHWNGHQWSVVASPSPQPDGSSLYSVSANSANDIWAVGFTYTRDGNPAPSRSLIEHWNGNQWSVVQSPDPGRTLNRLFAVSARSPDDAWAAGYFTTPPGPKDANGPQTQTFVVHWDGKQWSVVKAPDAQFGNIWVSAIASDRHSGNTWMVGFSGLTWSHFSQHMSIVLLSKG